MDMKTRDGLLSAVFGIRSQLQQVAEHVDVRGELLALVKNAVAAVDAASENLEQVPVYVEMEVPLSTRPHLVLDAKPAPVDNYRP